MARSSASLGQNGSGKSTTIRILTTLLAPTDGSARIAGLDIRTHGGMVRERIGVALQEAGLDELQTGRELLRLQAHLYGMARDRVEPRVDQLLEIVDLVDAASRPIRTYSGGMKRRLDLASALVHSPQIVFLDEPTTGLDPIGRQAIWRYIERLNQEDGVTFFLTTQHMEEADRLAQRIAILEAGRIVVEGSPRELKANIATDVVTVHVDGEDQAERAAELSRGLPGVEGRARHGEQRGGLHPRRQRRRGADRAAAGRGAGGRRLDHAGAAHAGRRVPAGHGPLPAGR